MKTTIISLLLSFIGLTAFSAPCADLFFSEYIEGSSFEKAIEIYNPTNSPISLSGYSVVLYTNGNSTANTTFVLFGTIPANGVYVISNSSAMLTDITNASDTTSGVTGFNGNDVLELLNGTTIIDVIGTKGSNTTFAANTTLVRMSTVSQGNLTYTSTEWTSNASNTTTFIGSHTSGCATSCTGFYRDSITTSICSFDSVNFRGTFYSTAGIYRDTVLSTCDTIFVLNLMTRTETVYPLFDTICSINDSLLFDGNYLKAAGTYYDTISRTGNCDSVVELSLYLKYCPMPCSEIYISEYIEGSGNNKALEFYNPTSDSIDLSNYSIVVYRTGNDTISLSGFVKSLDVHVICNPGTALIPIRSNSNDSTAPLYFNGDDRIALLKGSIVIDVFGDIGGTGDFAKDQTVHRDSLVQSGSSVYNASEWIVLPQNTDSLIGSHASSCSSFCIPTRDTLVTTVCAGDSATNGISFYNTTGVFADTIPNSTGTCDSIRVLNLTVSMVTRDTIITNLCEGDSILNGTNYYKMIGMYADTLTSVIGCDSIRVLNITAITPISRDTVSSTICEGDSATNGVMFYTVSGLHADTLSSSLGCDSIRVLNLTVTTASRDTVATTICEGDSATNGVKFYMTAGFNSDTLTSSLTGCDSILVLNLTVNAKDRDTTAMSICNGDSASFGGMFYKVAGIYSDTNTNITTGCDSISILNLTISANSNDTIQDTICQGASSMLGTSSYSTTGEYVDTIQSVTGCDSIVVLQLFVKDYIRDSIMDTICQGGSSMIGTMAYTTAGTYADTLSTMMGCDSIVVLNLFVNDFDRDTISATVCDNNPYTFGTQTLSTTGIYADTLQNSAGCDSIVVLNLTVKAVSRDTTISSICLGDSLLFGTKYYSMAGTYSDTNASSNGCDSISVLTLTTISLPITNITTSACDSFALPSGRFVNFTGVFIDTLMAVSGCDSVVSTSLTVNYSRTVSDTVSACGSYTSPSGKVWVSSGTRFDTIPTSLGCDSLITIVLTIHQNSQVFRNVASCFSYTVPETGNTYPVSGTYTDITTNAFGCVLTITTQLTINTVNAGTISLSGVVYTASATGVKYNWADCNNNYSHLRPDTNQTFTPPRNGNFAVIVVSPEGCRDTSDCLAINTVSLEEFDVTSNDISIYPNPASNVVSIDILRQNVNEEVRIRIFDAVGKLVYSREVSSTNNKVLFDVNELESGSYTVSVSNEFFSTTKKLLVVN